MQEKVFQKKKYPIPLPLLNQNHGFGVPKRNQGIWIVSRSGHWMGNLLLVRALETGRSRRRREQCRVTEKGPRVEQKNSAGTSMRIEIGNQQPDAAMRARVYHGFPHHDIIMIQTMAAIFTTWRGMFPIYYRVSSCFFEIPGNVYRRPLTKTVVM